MLTMAAEETGGGPFPISTDGQPPRQSAPLRESLETVADQIACVISGTSQRVPYLTVQSGEPSTESLDCCLIRSQCVRLLYDGSFLDGLRRAERMGGRNPPLHHGRSTHRIPGTPSLPPRTLALPTTQGNEAQRNQHTSTRNCRRITRSQRTALSRCPTG